MKYNLIKNKTLSISKIKRKPLSISEQIDYLKNHGLSINSLKETEEELIKIGYHRLKPYFYKFNIYQFNHKEGKGKFLKKFKRNTDFYKIIELYNFDRKLKILIFNTIEKIENSLKSNLISILLNKHNNFFIHKEKIIYYISQTQFEYELSELENKITYQNHQSVKCYLSKHHKENGGYPLTVFLNSLSFGDVLKFIGFLNKDTKNLLLKNIFKVNSFNDKDMLKKFKKIESELFEIKNIRNICAHHDVLFNYKDFKFYGLKLILKHGYLYANDKELKDLEKEIKYKFKNFFSIFYKHFKL